MKIANTVKTSSNFEKKNQKINLDELLKLYKEKKQNILGEGGCSGTSSPSNMIEVKIT